MLIHVFFPLVKRKVSGQWYVLMAAIHKRKAVKNQHENNQNKLSITKETGVESKENEDVKQKENIGSKVFGYMKLTVQLLVLLTLAPALVNFAALLREEKELKPEGILKRILMAQEIFLFMLVINRC